MEFVDDFRLNVNHNELQYGMYGYKFGRVLATSAGGPGFNPQSRTASYQRRYKNGTGSSLV